MKEKNTLKGTAAYIAGDVQRFDQKNEMFKRSMWDPAFKAIREVYYGPSYPTDKDGFSHEDLALFIASWYIEWGFAFGTIIQDTGIYSWDPPPTAVKRLPPDIRLTVDDPAEMARHIKQVAKYFGAIEVGISEIDQRWVYAKTYNMATGEHKPFQLPAECRYAISFILEMDYHLVKTSPTWLARAAEGKGYSIRFQTYVQYVHFFL